MTEAAELREQLDTEKGARMEMLSLGAQSLATAASAHRGQKAVNELARALEVLCIGHAAGRDINTKPKG